MIPQNYRIDMLTRTISILIDELLWILTWGWWQLVMSIILSWKLFVFIGRMKTVRALLLITASYSFALITYFLVVAGLFITYFKWRFIPGNAPSVLNPATASCMLGIIYSLLQTIFFCIIKKGWGHISISRLGLLSFVSNMTVAFISSLFVGFTL